MNARCVTLAVVVGLALVGAACAGDDPTAATSGRETTTTTRPLSGDITDWAIGVPYDSTSLRVDGRDLGAAEAVSVERLGPNVMTVGAAGCSVGTATFSLDGRRMSEVEIGNLLMACEMEDPEIYFAVAELIEGGPSIGVDGRTITFRSTTAELELRTDADLTNIADGTTEVDTGVVFTSISSTIEGVGQGTVSFVADAYFAATLTVSGCTLHASIGTDGIGEPGPRDFIGALDDRFCEANERTALDVISFLHEQPRIEAMEGGMRLVGPDTGDQIELMTAPSAP